MLIQTAKSVTAYLASSRFMRFSMVGTLGFIVDTAVLYAALHLGGLNLLLGRVVSYLAAATTTWYLNRHYTFTNSRDPRWTRQWLRFLLVNTAGGAVNYTVYAWMVLTIEVVASYPVIGVAAGSVAGLIVNYSCSRIFVFSNNQNTMDNQT
jgi:putative flippase GtrA